VRPRLSVMHIYLDEFRIMFRALAKLRAASVASGLGKAANAPLRDIPVIEDNRMWPVQGLGDDLLDFHKSDDLNIVSLGYLLYLIKGQCCSY
jgi:hypothetical protein